MLPEVARFNKFLRRKQPDTSTHRHYTNDLDLFLAWADKPPAAITLRLFRLTLTYLRLSNSRCQGDFSVFERSAI